MAAWWIGRRDLLASATAMLLSGCIKGNGVKPPPPNDPRLKIGDAHAHLFNGADLPVSGFFKNVLAPAYLDGWPEFILALLDSAMRKLKQHSKTASEEIDQIKPPYQPTVELTALQFAADIAAQANPILLEQREMAFAADPRTNLAASYRALAELIESERRRQQKLAPQDVAGPTDRIAQIDIPTLAAIAQSGAAVLEAGASPQAYFKGRLPVDPFALIHWAFVMTHSRSAHVREYLNAMESAATRPTLLINLLVDYDLWLADRPTAGSEMSRQVEFWTRYSKDVTGPVRIATFAGYDPLKHAVCKRLGDHSYFDALKTWTLSDETANARVAGLKLYPPMGFRVSKNDSFPPASIGRGAAIVHELWTENGWDVLDLPERLDGALTDLFDFATRHDVPLMAHGRNSNEAFAGAGANAHPRYWLERALALPPTAGSHPLRACIAHFRAQFDAEHTVRKILDLNLAGQANIYFDIAFDEEILDPHEADELLNLIAGLCKGRETAADHFMFGTDWIMLAQIPHHERYVDAFDAAIKRCAFWQARREELLGGNLRRFLKLDAGPGA